MASVQKQAQSSSGHQYREEDEEEVDHAAVGQSVGQESGKADRKGSVRILLQMLPAASTFSLSMAITGVILFAVGFLLTRSAIDNYLRARSSVTFDIVFPDLIYWAIGIAVGQVVYSSLHYMINVAANAVAKSGTRATPMLQAVTVMWLILDSLLICCWCLGLSAAFILIFVHIIYASRLRRGLSELDVNYFVTEWPVSPSLVIRHWESGETPSAATAAATNVTTFTTFYPALLLFIGVSVCQIAVIMSMTFLAVNLSMSRRNGKKNSSSNSSDDQQHIAYDTQL